MAMPAGPGPAEPAWPGHTPQQCCAGCGALATASCPNEGLFRTACPVLRALCHLPREALLGGVPVLHSEDVR